MAEASSGSGLGRALGFVAPRARVRGGGFRRRHEILGSSRRAYGGGIGGLWRLEGGDGDVCASCVVECGGFLSIFHRVKAGCQWVTLVTLVWQL